MTKLVSTQPALAHNKPPKLEFFADKENVGHGLNSPSDDVSPLCTLSDDRSSCGGDLEVGVGIENQNLINVAKSSVPVSNNKFTPQSSPRLFQRKSINQKRGRKSNAPLKAVPVTDDGVPGVKLKFDIELDSFSISLTKRPQEYPAYTRLVQEASLRSKRRKESVSEHTDGLLVDDVMDGCSFPSSELFFNNFGEFDEEYYERRLRAAPKRRRSEDDVSEHDEESVYEELFDEELGITPPATPMKKKVKKQQAMVKKPRASRKTTGEKVCVSCKTNQTPIWREVKDHWGEGWEDILLCNACGLRTFLILLILEWRMCGLRCDECSYVPRASEKRIKKCTRCDNGKWFRQS
jgi:hypothetical protein